MDPKEHTMFSKIVVGVDAREGGRDALALAQGLARTFDGELIAVHVYPYDYFISRGATGDVEAVMNEAAKETLTTELERAAIASRTSSCRRSASATTAPPSPRRRSSWRTSSLRRRARA